MQIAALDAAHRAGVILATETGNDADAVDVGKSGAPHASCSTGLAKMPRPPRMRKARPRGACRPTPREPRRSPHTVSSRQTLHSARTARGQHRRPHRSSRSAQCLEMLTGRQACGLPFAMPSAPAALERLVAICLSKIRRSLVRNTRSAPAAIDCGRSGCPRSSAGSAARTVCGRWRAAVALSWRWACSRASQSGEAGLDILSILPSAETRWSAVKRPRFHRTAGAAFIAADRAGRAALAGGMRCGAGAAPTRTAHMPFWAPAAAARIFRRGPA
jgi:hypothetical protein